MVVLNTIVTNDPNFFQRVFLGDAPDYMEEDTVYGNTGGNIFNQSAFTEVNDRIYYFYSYADHECVLSFTANSISSEVIGESPSENQLALRITDEKSIPKCVQIMDNTIFFFTNAAIYKEDLTGGGYKVKLVDVTAHKTASENKVYYYIVNEWVYYHYNDRICKIRIDGTASAKITPFRGFLFAVGEGWIFYLEDSDIFKIRTNGAEKQRIATINNYSSDASGGVIDADVFFIDSGSLYYKSDGCIYRMNISTGQSELVLQPVAGRRIVAVNAQDQMFYYLSEPTNLNESAEETDRSVFRVDLSTNEEKQLTDHYATDTQAVYGEEYYERLTVIDGYLYAVTTYEKYDDLVSRDGHWVPLEDPRHIRQVSAHGKDRMIRINYDLWSEP